jgi:indolepyruvate ferredoxin oxidoreductase
VAGVAQQLAAEGVQPVMVVSDHPQKVRGSNGLPPSVTVHHRRELDRLQRELREVRGVSALIYDQTCAAELHRKRKRGTVPTPDRASSSTTSCARAAATATCSRIASP